MRKRVQCLEEIMEELTVIGNAQCMRALLREAQAEASQDSLPLLSRFVLEAHGLYPENVEVRFLTSLY